MNKSKEQISEEALLTILEFQKSVCSVAKTDPKDFVEFDKNLTIFGETYGKLYNFILNLESKVKE